MAIADIWGLGRGSVCVLARRRGRIASPWGKGYNRARAGVGVGERGE